MTLKRTLLDLGDHGPTRGILGKAFSRLARPHDLRVHHDGQFWLFTSKGTSLPHSRRFSFFKDDFARLPRQMSHYLDETQDCWFFLYKPKAGDVIVDVGAELGTDAISFSRAVGPSGKVIAIEAQPETFAMLEATVRANDLRNVIPLSLAVADGPGEVRISSDASVESNFLSDKGIPVRADSLDNILRDVPKVDLLKMNIEGAERLAILGMEETIRKTEYVAIACHDFVGRRTGNDWFNTRDLVVNFLKGHGFDVTMRDDDPREYARYHIHGVRAA